jgi:hypothetical protein
MARVAAALKSAFTFSIPALSSSSGASSLSAKGMALGATALPAVLRLVCRYLFAAVPGLLTWLALRPAWASCTPATAPCSDV